jgi:nucleotide-binding universal stress UspA family protein
MPEVEKILFALELVDISSDIVPWVNLLAEKFEAEIHLLHVVPEIAYTGFPYAVAPSVDVNAMLASAENKVNDFKNTHIANNHPSRVSVDSGDPTEQILAYIDRNGISMVVLGTHGRKGLNRAIFGSVADRVLRTSPVPVFCVNPYGSSKEEAVS